MKYKVGDVVVTRVSSSYTGRSGNEYRKEKPYRMKVLEVSKDQLTCTLEEAGMKPIKSLFRVSYVPGAYYTWRVDPFSTNLNKILNEDK